MQRTVLIDSIRLDQKCTTIKLSYHLLVYFISCCKIQFYGLIFGIWDAHQLCKYIQLPQRMLMASFQLTHSHTLKQKKKFYELLLCGCGGMLRSILHYFLQHQNDIVITGIAINSHRDIHVLSEMSFF